MNDSITPHDINEDAKNRVEWINKRVPLNKQQKDYTEFQIKEAIKNALSCKCGGKCNL